MDNLAFGIQNARDLHLLARERTRLFLMVEAVNLAF
jgi:hypothetical protein